MQAHTTAEIIISEFCVMLVASVVAGHPMSKAVVDHHMKYLRLVTQCSCIGHLMWTDMLV